MFKNWLITGDTHGRFERFKTLEEQYKDDDTAIICLGDMGLNFHLDEKDIATKKGLTRRNMQTFYCVRGNHEARPEDIRSMKLMFDENVGGDVFYEPEFPTIRYFLDYGIYHINGLTVGVIGGAYSVDKFIRQSRGWPWFENELLTEQERSECAMMFMSYDEPIDIMLTHTCPISWEPTDLFLNGINQSTVDKSMEIFLEDMKQTIGWNIWCFGHYHADRIERPHVEQLFNDIENLGDIIYRWENYDETGELDWWLHKAPRFYME